MQHGGVVTVAMISRDACKTSIHWINHYPVDRVVCFVKT